MNLLLLLSWLLGTLVFVTLFALLAKKYGVQFLSAAMAVSILLANIMNVKFVEVFGYAAPAGVLIFAMTFFISDTLSEFWGKKEAQKAVWIGFLGSLLYLFVLQVTVAWPPAPFSVQASENFATLYDLLPRIVLGSIVAYLLVQHFDVWLYHEIKRVTNGRWLWLRNNVSTTVSQLLDSIVFFTIAYLGTVMFPDPSSLIAPILTIWIIKSVIAVFDTPFMYLLRFLMRRLSSPVSSPSVPKQ